jgi:hypothetical protein
VETEKRNVVTGISGHQTPGFSKSEILWGRPPRSPVLSRVHPFWKIVGALMVGPNKDYIIS